MITRRRVSHVGLTALVWALHSAAIAQQPPQAPPPPTADPSNPAAQGAATGGLAEIIVTATRRGTNLQTTPIAVSAVDSSLIKQAAPRDIGDLAAYVPNFSAAKITGANAASFAMRGVGVNNQIVYYEAPVGVLVDDFVIPSVQTQLLDTFDIAQIEVLRGPQGTLFGKNTTGGAITVRTKRPNLDKMTIEGRVSYGSFAEYKAQGAIDLPLIHDVLGLRVVGGYDHSHGYLRNGYCYGPVTSFAPAGSYGAQFNGASGCGDGGHLGGTKVVNARAKLLYQPSDKVSVLLQYEILRDHSGAAAAVQDTPAGSNFLLNLLGVGGPQDKQGGSVLDAHGSTNRDDAYLDINHWRVDVDGFYLNANFDMGVGTLTDVTGYRTQRSRLPNSTTGDGSIVAADGTALSLFDLNRADDRKTFQQELRFASKLGGPFDFVSGIFYQHENVNFCVAQVLGFEDLVGASTPYGPFNENPYVLCNAQRSDSTAVFTEGTYKITDKLTLTVGGRYTWENKRWQGRQQAFVQDITGNPTTTWRDVPLLDLSDFQRFPNGVVTTSANFKKPTWRASLGYKVTQGVYAYATYSRGFKGGDFNDQIGSFAPFGDNLDAFRAAAAATKPETADSYEAGIKTEFLDHRVRFNVTGFYVDYQNLQKQIVTPLSVNGQTFQVTRFFNAASADVKGVEAELTVIPFHGLTLRGNLGYQDGRYKKYVTPIPAGYDLSTSPLDRAPKWQGAATASYDVPITDDFHGFITGSVAYTGRNLYSQSITSPDENAYLEKHTVVNGSIGVNGPNDGYSIRLIGRNLTNKIYRTARLVVGGLWTFSNYAEPRSFAVEGSFKF